MTVENGGNESCNKESYQPGLMRFTCREGKRRKEWMVFFYKNQQGQQAKESNVLQTSLEDKKSSLVPVISVWSGMPSSGVAIVLELVHLSAGALFSDVVCLSHLVGMHERQFFFL